MNEKPLLFHNGNAMKSVLKMVLGRARDESLWGGSRGFSSYYAALVSNLSLDLCATDSAGLEA